MIHIHVTCVHILKNVKWLYQSKISLNIHFQTLNSRISSFSFQVKPLKVTISSSTSVIAVSVTEVPALCVIEWSWNIDFFFLW